MLICYPTIASGAFDLFSLAIIVDANANATENMPTYSGSFMYVRSHGRDSPAISEILGLGRSNEINSKISTYASEATNIKNATPNVAAAKSAIEYRGKCCLARRAVVHVPTSMSNATVKSIANDNESKLEKLKRPRPLVAKHSGQP